MMAGMKLPQKLRINSEINENNFGTGGVILDDNQISVVADDQLLLRQSENILSAPLSKVNTNLKMDQVTAPASQMVT